MDPAVIAITFGAIFLVELPDKTFLATLVLATRYRPLLVWIGVGFAFAVQTLVAVAVGKAASFLPHDLIHSVAAAMFFLGAILLVREGFSHQQKDGEEELATKDVHGIRIVLTCFLVLFAAEWGDLSQLLTITFVARYDDPVSVFIGALGALLLVSGLAVVAGRTLLRFVKLHVLHFAGAAVCLVLGVLTVVELVG
ncbi:MAG: TMEM165/GDT1 family protein [Nocardioides sp.]